MAVNRRSSPGLGVTLLLAFLGLAAGYFFTLAGNVEARTPRGPSLRDIQEKAEEIEQQEMTIAELIGRVEVLGEICNVNTDVNVDCALACESDCCFPHEGIGCDDLQCEDAVCAADSFCCNIGWDGICAAEALDLCGDLCIGCDEPDFEGE